MPAERVVGVQVCASMAQCVAVSSLTATSCARDGVCGVRLALKGGPRVFCVTFVPLRNLFLPEVRRHAAKPGSVVHRG
jgi:hypothetical protein